MATSPSESGSPNRGVPPEVVAIAVALAATMAELGADAAPMPPDDRGSWRWQGWDR